MQNLTQPTLLLKPFAESGDKNTLPVTNTDLANPQLADLTNGFPQITSESPDNGGLPPERKDFNALGYLTTTYDWFYQAGGRFTFSSTIANAINGYPLNATLWYTDNSGNTTLLRSTKANNKDNFITNPSFIGTSWKQEIPVLGWSNTWTGSNTFSGSVSLGALATATSPSASDSSTKVATTAWANNTSNNLVHKTGTETMTGAKTFTNSVNRQGSWTAGTAPSSNIASAYNFTDSTGTVYGTVDKFYHTNGTFYTRMTGRRTDGTGQIEISIGYDSNGNARALAPTPDTTTATNSTQIATTGWVNTVGNNVMHLTGTESIGGSKTFTGSVELGSSATAETKSSGTSGTSVATTAYVKACVPKSVGASSRPVYTDSSGVITECNLGIPGYSSRVTFSTNSYQPTENGLIVVRAGGSNGKSMAEILYANTPIARSECADSGGSTQVVWAFVRKGNTYTINSTGTVTRWFVPLS